MNALINMDFDIIQSKLKEVFEAGRIFYYGKNHQTTLHEYNLVCKSITALVNSNWSKSFPNGSYYSIAKSVNTVGLSIIVSVSNEDFKSILQSEAIKA